MPLDDVLLEAEDKMLKTEEVVNREFSGVRTGPGCAPARLPLDWWRTSRWKFMGR
jgi:hypothetical protein